MLEPPTMTCHQAQPQLFFEHVVFLPNQPIIVRDKRRPWRRDTVSVSSNHDKFVSPSRRDAVARPRQACQEIRPYNGGQWWWSIRPYKEIKNHEGLLTKKMRFGMDMNGWSLPKIAYKFRDSVPSTSMFQVPVPGPARKNRRCLIFQVSDWHCTWLDTVPSNWEGFGWSPESVYIYTYIYIYTYVYNVYKKTCISLYTVLMTLR